MVGYLMIATAVASLLIGIYGRFQAPLKVSLATSLAEGSSGSVGGRELHELYRKLAEQRQMQAEALESQVAFDFCFSFDF